LKSHLAFSNYTRACFNHIHACRNHTLSVKSHSVCINLTRACRNHTRECVCKSHSAGGNCILHVEITLVRVEITLVRVVITLVRVFIISYSEWINNTRKQNLQIQYEKKIIALFTPIIPLPLWIRAWLKFKNMFFPKNLLAFLKFGIKNIWKMWKIHSIIFLTIFHFLILQNRRFSFCK
jgi:hypothetical protein